MTAATVPRSSPFGVAGGNGRKVTSTAFDSAGVVGPHVRVNSETSFAPGTSFRSSGRR